MSQSSVDPKEDVVQADVFRDRPIYGGTCAVGRMKKAMAAHGPINVHTETSMKNLIEAGKNGALILWATAATYKDPAIKSFKTFSFIPVARRYHRGNHESARSKPIICVQSDFSRLEDTTGEFLRPLMKFEAEGPRTMFNNLFLCDGEGHWFAKYIREPLEIRPDEFIFVDQEFTQNDVLDFVAERVPDPSIAPMPVQILQEVWKAQGFDTLPISPGELFRVKEKAFAEQPDNYKTAFERFTAQKEKLQTLDLPRMLSKYAPGIEAVVFVTFEFGVIPTAGIPLFPGIWDLSVLAESVLRRVLYTPALQAAVLVLPWDLMDMENVPCISGIDLKLGQSYAFAAVSDLLDDVEGRLRHNSSISPESFVASSATALGGKRKKAKKAKAKGAAVETWVKRASGPAPGIQAEMEEIARQIKAQRKTWLETNPHQDKAAELLGGQRQPREGFNYRKELPFELFGYEMTVLYTARPVTTYMFETKDDYGAKSMVNLSMMKASLVNSLIGLKAKPTRFLTIAKTTLGYMLSRHLTVDPFYYCLMNQANTRDVYRGEEQILALLARQPNDLMAFYQLFGSIQRLMPNDGVVLRGTKVGEPDVERGTADARGAWADLLSRRTEAQARKEKYAAYIAERDGQTTKLGGSLRHILDVGFDDEVHDDDNDEEDQEQKEDKPAASALESAEALLDDSHAAEGGHIVEIETKKEKENPLKKVFPWYKYKAAPSWQGKQGKNGGLGGFNQPNYTIELLDIHSRYEVAVNLDGPSVHPFLRLPHRRIAGDMLGMNTGYLPMTSSTISLFFAVTRYEYILGDVDERQRNEIGKFCRIVGPSPTYTDVLMAIRPPQLALSHVLHTQARFKSELLRRTKEMDKVKIDLEILKAPIETYESKLEKWKKDHLAWEKECEEHKDDPEFVKPYEPLKPVPSKELEAWRKMVVNTAETHLKLNMGHEVETVSPEPLSPVAGPVSEVGLGGQAGSTRTPPSGFVIYGRTGCPFTEAARKLVPHVFHEAEPGSDTIAKALKGRVHSTVPVVFKNNEFIGGYTELKQFLSEDGH